MGVDNIDIATATALGVAVINAPAGNTIAVVELFFGTVIGLLRHLPHAATSMRDGKWDRSQLLGSQERGYELPALSAARAEFERALGGQIDWDDL